MQQIRSLPIWLSRTWVKRIPKIGLVGSDMSQGWKVNGCQKKYYIVLSTEEQSKEDNRKSGHGNKEIHFQQAVTCGCMQKSCCWRLFLTSTIISSTSRRLIYSGPSRATAGPGKTLSRGPINPPLLYVLRLRHRRRREGGNVGRGVPSPTDWGFGGAL